MQTYTETVLRYRILVHEELPEDHKRCLRERGIDPDDNWSLRWSFDDYFRATEMLARERADAASFQTFKLVDAGEASTIERPVY